MAEIRQLTTVEQWEKALDASREKPLLVFKHSTRCPVSAGAHEEFDRYVADRADADIAYALVHVVEDRPVSNAVAESTGIKHESPQAILLKNGSPEWHASHWHITYSFLSEKLGEPTSAR